MFALDTQDACYLSDMSVPLKTSRTLLATGGLSQVSSRVHVCILTLNPPYYTDLLYLKEPDIGTTDMDKEPSTPISNGLNG